MVELFGVTIEDSFLMVILTAFYVIATIVLVWSTTTLNKKTLEQIQTQDCPHISIHLLYEDTVARLQVLNDGNKDAYNISITLKESLNIDKDHAHNQFILDNVEKLKKSSFNLGKGSQLKMFFGQTWDLGKIQPCLIHFAVKYSSEKKIEYSEEYEINLAENISWAENTAQYTIGYQIKKTGL